MIGSKVGHSLDAVLLSAYRFLFWGRSVSPNTLTVFGLFFSMVAAFLVAARGQLLVAGVVLLVSGFFDLLDGAVARNTDRVTLFGGFFDSVLDRYSDLLVMFAISVHFLRAGDQLFSTVTFFAAIGVAIIPYARARAEAAGITCNNGLLERPERVLLVVFGLVFDVLRPVTVVLALLTHVTVIQRVLFARRAAAGQ